MNNPMLKALMWYRGKMSEYAEKITNLGELLPIMGKEAYEKCNEYYSGEYSKYEAMEAAIAKYIEYDNAEKDLAHQLMGDIPTPEEMQEIKEAAEEALKFYQERS